MTQDTERTPDGRFAPGNTQARGNPFAKRVGELRSALLEAVTPEDIREIIRGMVAQAKAGDVAAAREVLLRVLGRPLEADILERLEALEEAVLHDTPATN